jgi:hypothetical protein
MDELLRALTVVGVIAGIAAAIVAASVSLHWVLGPLDRAAKNRQFPIQFGLADMLCLFILIQLPIGVIHWTLRGVDQPAAVVPDVLVGVVATLVWWVCWRTMSRAGVLVVWQRVLVLAIVLPGGYVGSLALAILPIAVVALFSSHQPTIASWLVVVELSLPVVLYFFGRFTRSIVASSRNNVAVDAIVLPDDWKEPTISEEQGS